MTSVTAFPLEVIEEGVAAIEAALDGECFLFEMEGVNIGPEGCDAAGDGAGRFRLSSTGLSFFTLAILTRDNLD